MGSPAIFEAVAVGWMESCVRRERRGEERKVYEGESIVAGFMML